MRVDYRSVFPAAVTAMAGLEQAVQSSSLEAELLELVKLRASQINGCGYCVDMHTKDATNMGVENQRLHLVVAWKEAPVYSPRERAALAWCEALTMLPSSGAPDDVYEIVALTLAIVAINGWNRFAVGLRALVGNYVPRAAPATTAP
jgi:AhpD family alkylhydroperoxidase